MDTQYQDSKWNTPQVPHLYNDKTFIVYNPLMLNVLGRLSSPNCKQPQFNQLIEYLYEYLFMVSANQLISQSSVSIPTRMEGCKWEGTNLNPKRNLVTVSIARAGIIPSTIIFNRLCHIFPPERIRQDHVFMNRKTDEEGRVTGVNFSGSKISAPVSNDALFIPDPMGATGSTVEYVVQYYKEQFPKANPLFVCLNLIITPQYLEKISYVTFQFFI